MHQAADARFATAQPTHRIRDRSVSGPQPVAHRNLSAVGAACNEESIALTGEPGWDRLNLRGNRVLNHAIHIAAVTQLRHDTNGRIYYHKKIAEGKTPKEAIRALKRRISDAVYQRLTADINNQ